MATLSGYLHIRMSVSTDEKRLEWSGNGQTTIFTRPGTPSAPLEAKTASGLRKGMAVNEVMDFFRNPDISAESLPGDPDRMVSDFSTDPSGGSYTVRLVYVRKEGKVGLEGVQIIRDGRRRSVPIR